MHDYPTHPLTGTKLNGFQLPNWDKALDVLHRASREMYALPGCRYLGWDIAFSKTARSPSSNATGGRGRRRSSRTPRASTTSWLRWAKSPDHPAGRYLAPDGFPNASKAPKRERRPLFLQGRRRPFAIGGKCLVAKTSAPAAHTVKRCFMVCRRPPLSKHLAVWRRLPAKGALPAHTKTAGGTPPGRPFCICKPAYRAIARSRAASAMRLALSKRR